MEKNYQTEQKNGYFLVHNQGGPTLGFQDGAADRILEADGFAFKDLNGNGVLDPYEDWRLPVAARVRDLISRMERASKLGLCLHDGMFMVMHFTPELVNESPFLRARLDLMNKSLEELNSLDPTEPTAYNKELIEHDEMRFWLMGAVEGPEFAAEYNNRIQALAERHKLGIPVFFSTNPRAFQDTHSDRLERDVSSWPSNLGLAATFDPAVAKDMAETVSKEYRAMGITVELGPQIDLASDPRWSRLGATFGANEKLTADMARAVCDGYQTASSGLEIEDGWGRDSVLAMCKHWPGSTGEGGRESHAQEGKYAVYPGGSFDKHIYPWTGGAFQLEGPTSQCGAVMTCYDAIWGPDGENGALCGASFNEYVVERLLREKFDFKGFVCTDFWITGFYKAERATRPRVNAWGYEDAAPEVRALKEWEAGIDQLGGTNEIEVVEKAYQLALQRHGRAWIDGRIDSIARRILTFAFRVGSFENPYVDPDYAMTYVGSADKREKGMEAHRKSVILVKNRSLLPLAGHMKLYIADKYSGGIPDRAGHIDPIATSKPISTELAEQYFTVVDTPEESDFALVFMDSPQSGPGFDGLTGEILPISLQYGAYTAVNARAVSIAGNHIDGTKENRSYRGKTVRTYNQYDLDNLMDVKSRMGEKPVVVVLRCVNPMVPSELEPAADAVVVSFLGLPDVVLLELLRGKYEPSGMLPFQMPADMDAVETHFEDTPGDITPYIDEDGNSWDFAFGLNWSGVICDERTQKYKGGSPLHEI